MRPGRANDLPAMTRLWEHEAVAGRRDAVPPESLMQRVLAGFDWAACSRVFETDDRVTGMVLVLRRATGDATIARVEAAGEPMEDLVRWGLGLAGAAGAQVAQVWRPRGQCEWLRELGLLPVRPWLRMDRPLAGDLPPAVPIAGYRLADPAEVAPQAWSDVFNRAFADHWRHTPRSDEHPPPGPPELSLLAVDAAGRPAAITLCEIEHHTVDRRPQPVGVVGSVGTVPAHRRRGVARWLVGEALHRLRDAGAATASLYVDGLNEHRAVDLYTDLGFLVTFDTTVWEATFP